MKTLDIIAGYARRYCGFQALCLAMTLVVPGGAFADETGTLLFSNPLVRDSTALPKLQKLRFVTVDGFAPFSAFDETGVLRGVHVDLARAICEQIKLSSECTLQAADFDDVEYLLISGQADVALAGIVPTVKNRSNLSFSSPYFRYPAKFFANRDWVLNAEAKIGVIAGSVHQKMADVLFPKLKRLSLATEQDAISALKAGTIAAMFGDGVQLAALQTATGLECCRLGSDNYFLPSLRPDTLRAAISNKQTDIVTLVDSALRQLSINGRLDEIYLRHLPVNPLK